MPHAYTRQVQVCLRISAEHSICIEKRRGGVTLLPRTTLATCTRTVKVLPEIRQRLCNGMPGQHNRVMQTLIVHLQPLPARYGIPSDSLSEWLPNAFEAIWIFRPMYLWWIIGVLEKGKTPASWIAPQWLWAVENVAQLHAGDHPIATKMLLDLISASVERKLIEGQGGRDEVMSQAYLPIISAYDEGEMKSTKSASSGLDLDEAMSSGRP